MVSGRLINPGGGIRIKETRVIHAVRMFIQKYPGFRRPWINEFGGVPDVLVKRPPRTGFRIAVAHADIAASFQQAVVDCFVDRTRRALAVSDAPTLVVAGGVAGPGERRLVDRGVGGVPAGGRVRGCRSSARPSGQAPELGVVDTGLLSGANPVIG
jgi:hypothetical protein